MRIKLIDPPRAFRVSSLNPATELKDCAHIELEPNEQVTFTTGSGSEYDVARKSWGYYATPSLNGRLRKFGLRAVLVKNQIGRFYILFIEAGKEADFQDYLESNDEIIVCWLDSDGALQLLEQKLTNRQ